MDNKLAQFSKAIRSSLPGRLRLRMPLLKGLDDQTADLLTTWLKVGHPASTLFLIRESAAHSSRGILSVIRWILNPS